MIILEKNTTKHFYWDQRWSNTYISHGWYLVRTFCFWKMRLDVYSKNPWGKGTGFLIDWITTLLFVIPMALFVMWMGWLP